MRWTGKSCRNIASELRDNGYSVSEWLVRDILSNLGYSL
ncbi:MAG: hypothetical protein LBR11_00750 [Deltaproteobacteria bacterium]|nr:hypothetical protein [Deltaproteobacteria bacterium]